MYKLTNFQKTKSSLTKAILHPGKNCNPNNESRQSTRPLKLGMTLTAHQQTLPNHFFFTAKSFHESLTPLWGGYFFSRDKTLTRARSKGLLIVCLRNIKLPSIFVRSMKWIYSLEVRGVKLRFFCSWIYRGYKWCREVGNFCKLLKRLKFKYSARKN